MDLISSPAFAFLAIALIAYITVKKIRARVFPIMLPPIIALLVWELSFKICSYFNLNISYAFQIIIGLTLALITYLLLNFLFKKKQ
ncbi:hypothetical protein [Bacillus cihuensis]|uniref:hypothetical protein n=1 Tax=Bacillus cihuensis TaxID=1208599 RepID=UPI0004025475|nr:hypothetical protein [Bacillus cihuensis]